MSHAMALALLLLPRSVYCVNSNKSVSSTSVKTLQPITLAIILPSAKPYIFRRQLVQPAIEYAVASVEKEMASIGYRYEVEYRDSFCDGHRASLSARYFHLISTKQNASLYQRGWKTGKLGSLFKRKRRELSYPIRPRISQHALAFSSTKMTPMVFFGPACNGAAEEVSLLAETWNIPMITSGAPALRIHPDQLTTLTRIGPSHYDIAQFLWRIFTERDYGKEYPIHLLYEAGWDSGRSEGYVLNVTAVLTNLRIILFGIAIALAIEETQTLWF